MMINKKISTNSELKTVMFHRPCSISNGLKMSLISKNKDSGTMLIFPHHFVKGQNKLIMIKLYRIIIYRRVISTPS